jgi:hypothetical protein
MASEGLVASFKLLNFLIISTISNGLVGISELLSSFLVVESISNSSNKYSAFKKSPLREIKEIKKINKDVDLEKFLLKKYFILFDFKIL